MVKRAVPDYSRAALGLFRAGRTPSLIHADGTRSAALMERSTRRPPMRAVECPCGEHLEARSDAELTEAVKQHAANEHPDTYSDADLRVLVDTTAYDTGTTAGD
jgi:predicted small metal-binding protein